MGATYPIHRNHPTLPVTVEPSGCWIPVAYRLLKGLTLQLSQLVAVTVIINFGTSIQDAGFESGLGSGVPGWPCGVVGVGVCGSWGRGLAYLRLLYSLPSSLGPTHAGPCSPWAPHAPSGPP